MHFTMKRGVSRLILAGALLGGCTASFAAPAKVADGVLVARDDRVVAVGLVGVWHTATP